MQSESLAIRAMFGAFLAIALALRLLSPAGFMPAFDHGAVTIVACPDYGAAAAHHHHGDPKKLQHQCPYGAAAATATHAGIFPIASAMLFGAAPLFGRTFRFLEQHRSRDRPPSTGPPRPA